MVDIPYLVHSTSELKSWATELSGKVRVMRKSISFGAAVLIVGYVVYQVIFYTAGTTATQTTKGANSREFKVVGTWGNLEHWKERESRFWKHTLPQVSGGAMVANAKPLTELGLSGFELMRQLRLGTFDFAHGVLSNVASDSPTIEGADLAAIVQDLPTYRKVLEAYRPILEREFHEKFRARILMLYAWPSQQLWCNLGDQNLTEISLKDLEGKKIRAFNTSLGDLIEGLNGSAVTITFSEVVPALQKGVADCGITGTLPAYNAKWYQVVTHNVRLRIGYVSSFMAVNNRVWDSLSEENRKLIELETAKLEDEMWAATAINDQRGMDCNAAGPCDLGEPGGLVPIEPSVSDKAKLKTILHDFVLKRWAQRCGKVCADEWNDRVGVLLDLEASG